MKPQWMLLVLAVLVSIPAGADEPVPIERLREDFATWNFGMFIHFNMATFHNRQWANGYEDPTTFAPDKLDCDQWIDAAASAGMKYAVLTVKHTGGWCLWDSKHTTTHDMGALVNYKNGKGDIVRQFVDACRKRGVKVGFYYCFPRDFGSPKDKPSLRGLPPQAKGDPVAFVKKQLTELLTRYGPVDLLWCDQYQFDVYKNWQEIRKHVKSHQPNCLIIANNSLDYKDTDIHSYEYPWLKHKRPKQALPPEDNTEPAEVCDVIGHSWFWSNKETASSLKSAEKIVTMLKLCNSRRANYLLNVVPDQSGLIPDLFLKRLREIGKRLGVEDSTGTKSN